MMVCKVSVPKPSATVIVVTLLLNFYDKQNPFYYVKREIGCPNGFIFKSKRGGLILHLVSNTFGFIVYKHFYVLSHSILRTTHLGEDKVGIIIFMSQMRKPRLREYMWLVISHKSS